MTTLLDLQRLFAGDVNPTTRALLREQLADSGSDLRVFIDGIGTTPLSIALTTALSPAVAPVTGSVPVDSQHRTTSSDFGQQIRQLLHEQLESLPDSRHSQLSKANRELADEVFSRCVDEAQVSPPDARNFFLSFASTFARLLAERASEFVRQGGQPSDTSNDGQTPQHAISTTLGDTVRHPERVIRLYKGLQRLIQAAPELAQPFLLAVYAGRSYDEIAKLLGLTPAEAQDAVEVAAVEVSMD